jgi:hypothetical protein
MPAGCSPVLLLLLLIVMLPLVVMQPLLRSKATSFVPFKFTLRWRW